MCICVVIRPYAVSRGSLKSIKTIPLRKTQYCPFSVFILAVAVHGFKFGWGINTLILFIFFIEDMEIKQQFLRYEFWERERTTQSINF